VGLPVYDESNYLLYIRERVKKKEILFSSAMCHKKSFTDQIISRVPSSLDVGSVSWPKYVKNLVVGRFHSSIAIIASPRVRSRDYVTEWSVLKARPITWITWIFFIPTSHQINDYDEVAINRRTEAKNWHMLSIAFELLCSQRIFFYLYFWAISNLKYNMNGDKTYKFIKD